MSDNNFDNDDGKPADAEASEKFDINDELKNNGPEAAKARKEGAPKYESRKTLPPPRKRAHKKTTQGELRTDLGNARCLVRLYGEDLRYVHMWNNWLVWEDGHWRRDDNEAIMRLAKATVEQMFAEAAVIKDEEERAKARKWALTCQSVKRLNAMINLARSEIEVVLSVDKVDADRLLLGVTNGVIDLRKGIVEFREARRDDYVTKRADVAFDAAAKCPNWDEFLKKILDQEMIEYLQRAVGYTLTGLTVEEVMFILFGIGNNGKSTFRETIFAMMGSYAMSADASLLVTSKKYQGGATPELVRLHGMRLVTINETAENDRLNEARLKFITGTDQISARDLFEKLFDFLPTHKTWLTSNHKLIVRGTDEGIWRRIPHLPFIKMIPENERAQNFRVEKLIPELPGILNWALEGLRAYWKDGLKPPETVTKATNKYRKQMDLVGRWINEQCNEKDEAKTATTVLHNDYQEWTGFSISIETFGHKLAERGFEQAKVKGAKGKRVRGIQGLELRSEEEKQGQQEEMYLRGEGGNAAKTVQGGADDEELF